jgi:lipoprotein-anchoring transpeptidase ErfK/SrfK
VGSTAIEELEVKRTGPLWSSAGIIGFLIAFCAAAPAAMAAVTPSSSAATTTSGVVTAPSVSRVSIALGSPDVKPGQRSKIVATVVPRAANRVVTLKRFVHGRFIGIQTAVTTAKGVATFHAAFPVGSIRLRAFVDPDTIAPGGVSAPVTEQVVQVLPLVLPAGTTLSPGQSSALILDVQQRLTTLGYWMGSPDGYFGDATQQAIWALQKAAGIPRTGLVDPATMNALNNDVVPTPQTTSGNAIDVDLQRDLVMIVKNGKLTTILNCSTGGGYTYTEDGATDVAITPSGHFAINRVVDGLVVDSLGALWRPRFFDAGFAIHGDGDVPPEAVSHGCVRISNEAINWIWATNQAPVGLAVWLY